MKEPTLEVIHSAAFNVTTNARHQVFEKYGMWKVWEEGIQMAQQYLLTTHTVPLPKISKCRDKKFRCQKIGTSDRSGSISNDKYQRLYPKDLFCPKIINLPCKKLK